MMTVDAPQSLPQGDRTGVTYAVVIQRQFLQGCVVPMEYLKCIPSEKEEKKTTKTKKKKSAIGIINFAT